MWVIHFGKDDYDLVTWNIKYLHKERIKVTDTPLCSVLRHPTSPLAARRPKVPPATATRLPSSLLIPPPRNRDRRTISVYTLQGEPRVPTNFIGYCVL